MLTKDFIKNADERVDKQAELMKKEMRDFIINLQNKYRIYLYTKK